MFLEILKQNFILNYNFTELSKKQNKVVTVFLEYLLKEDKYEYEKNQIKSALDNYWKI